MNPLTRMSCLQMAVSLAEKAARTQSADEIVATAKYFENYLEDRQPTKPEPVKAAA